jgi:hypothetical protein
MRSVRPYIVATSWVRLAALGVLLVVCVMGCQTSHPAKKASAPATTPATSSTRTSTAAAESKCRARKPSSGDIIVRMITPGQQAVAQRLGGQWLWNHTTQTCQTSTRLVISAASGGAGFCTQVALAASNPAYNADATPAPPLKKVIASKGGSC